MLTDLREVIVRATGKEPVESAAKTLDYVASLCTQLIKQQNYDSDAWQQVRPPYHAATHVPDLALAFGHSGCFLCLHRPLLRHNPPLITYVT